MSLLWKVVSIPLETSSANEQGCVASLSIPPDGLEILADVLGVEIIATTIGGQDVVGSLVLLMIKVSSFTQMLPVTKFFS